MFFFYFTRCRQKRQYGYNCDIINVIVKTVYQILCMEYLVNELMLNVHIIKLYVSMFNKYRRIYFGRLVFILMETLSSPIGPLR